MVTEIGGALDSSNQVHVAFGDKSATPLSATAEQYNTSAATWDTQCNQFTSITVYGDLTMDVTPVGGRAGGRAGRWQHDT